VATNRQLVLIPAPNDDNADPGSLGAKSAFLQTLARYNIAPDGSPENVGVAFGPGFRVELPFVDDKDPVSQALITVTEEDNAWTVLSRLCRQCNWRLLDPESGRSFGI